MEEYIFFHEIDMPVILGAIKRIGNVRMRTHIKINPAKEKERHK